jgi:hypothetical protein
MRITSLFIFAVLSVALPFCHSMSISAVPEKMLLSASMKAAEIGKGVLIALSMSKESVSETNVFSVDEVIKSHTKAHGSVCFVVRRPG